MKVLLYGDWPLALTYLDPLAHHIRQHEPTWQVAYAGDIGRAPDPMTNPDVVVTCDELSVAPNATVKVCIFHGLASKGQAFSTARRKEFVEKPQTYAVPNQYYRDLLTGLGVPESRIFIAGLTKFDGLTRNILFAPTHNSQLSAIPVVMDRIYDIPGVKVHLHMYTRTGERAHHQEYRALYPQHEDREDIHDLLSWADTIIGDMGSIVVEALALGKRGIQVVNPLYKNYYRAKGIPEDELERLPEIYYPRRFGCVVHSAEELLEAVNITPVGSGSAAVVDWIKKQTS